MIKHYDCKITTVSPWRHPSTKDADQTPGGDSFECVTANAAAYLEANGIRKLVVPRYHSRFHDEFDPIITTDQHSSMLRVGSYRIENSVSLVAS